MGLMDGPGIRYVVFMQGCKLRCIYCHNPETWDLNGNSHFISAENLVEKICKYKPYFKNDGGVTFSGGEPLLQPEFLIECLKLCKQNKIHTALDTAGVGLGNYSEILKYTDLVILDVKAVDPAAYKKLTGHNIHDFEIFLKECQVQNKPLWLRQVIVPTINDTKENVLKLKEFADSLKNVKKIELLPYKTIGVHKYKTLKLKYRLNNIPEMNEDKCKELEKILFQ